MEISIKKRKQNPKIKFPSVLSVLYNNVQGPQLSAIFTSFSQSGIKPVFSPLSPWPSQHQWTTLHPSFHQRASQTHFYSPDLGSASISGSFPSTAPCPRPGLASGLLFLPWDPPSYPSLYLATLCLLSPPLRLPCHH